MCAFLLVVTCCIYKRVRNSCARWRRCVVVVVVVFLVPDASRIAGAWPAACFAKPSPNRRGAPTDVYLICLRSKSKHEAGSMLLVLVVGHLAMNMRVNWDDQ